MKIQSQKKNRTVMPEPGGPGGPLAPPIFGRSVNPIQTGGAQTVPTYYFWPPQYFSPSGITDVDSSYAKIFLILYPPLENSTTRITIVNTKELSRLFCNFKNFIRNAKETQTTMQLFKLSHLLLNRLCVNLELKARIAMRICIHLTFQALIQT